MNIPVFPYIWSDREKCSSQYPEGTMRASIMGGVYGVLGSGENWFVFSKFGSTSGHINSFPSEALARNRAEELQQNERWEEAERFRRSS